jgi:hypothetical protein
MCVYFARVSLVFPDFDILRVGTRVIIELVIYTFLAQYFEDIGLAVAIITPSLLLMALGVPYLSLILREALLMIFRIVNDSVVLHVNLLSGICNFLSRAGFNLAHTLVGNAPVN